MQRKTERNDELERLRRRYAGRAKEGKSRLLDEFCEHHGYERKYAIKLLQGGAAAVVVRSRPGPEPKYEPVQEVVERIWTGAEQLCGKRLAPALELWLPHYARHYGPLLPTQKKLLGSISAATLDRLLAHAKARVGGGLSGTRPGTLLRRQVPIQGEVWDEQRLGFLEADSVAHCGSSLAGSFIWSLTYTDLACTWTEGRAAYALTCLDEGLLHFQENIFLRLAPARWFSQASGDSFPVLEHLLEGKPRSYSMDYLAEGEGKFPPAASVPRLPASCIPRGKVRAPGPEPCRSTTPQTACRRARLWRSPGPAWADGRVGLSA